MTNLVTGAVVRLQIALAEARAREEGQTLVEYSLILAMVSIGSIVALLALSGKINGVFDEISGKL
ncbi:MAG: Flp family type IVb pilin [Gaiellaceae bacterium]